MRNVLALASMLLSMSTFGMEMIEFHDELTGDLSALVSKPSLGDAVLMSTKSDQNGVCKSLGYERGAVGSMIAGKSYRGPLVVLDSQGIVSAGEVATDKANSGFEIEQIICLNKIGSPTEKTINASSPVHLDSKVPFSDKSDKNGVCKALGYDRAAVGSHISGNSYRGAMVITSANGSISAGEVATQSSDSGYEIKSIVCIIKF